MIRHAVATASASPSRAVVALMTRMPSLNPAITTHRLLPSTYRPPIPSSSLMTSRFNNGIINGQGGNWMNVPSRGFAGDGARFGRLRAALSAAMEPKPTVFATVVHRVTNIAAILLALYLCFVLFWLAVWICLLVYATYIDPRPDSEGKSEGTTSATTSATTLDQDDTTADTVVSEHEE